MNRITRKFEIDAGHRVFGHESKCANLHGHRYVIEVTVAHQELDGLGRVLDFSVLKDVIGGWLDENWDHGMILYRKDPVASLYALHDGFAEMKCYLMDANPTAENMASHLLAVMPALLPPGFDAEKVVVRETPNCWAEARLQEEDDD